jgi:hypothetical protein
MTSPRFRPGHLALTVLVAIASVMTTAMQTARFEQVQPDLFAAGDAFTNAWADFDADGDLDQFVGFGGSGNRLYRQTDGRFEDVAASVGLASTRRTLSAAWGDADGDGDPDLLVGYADAPMLAFYRNDAGRFRDDTDTVGLRVDKGAVRQPVWVDFDGDGDLDLFVAFRDRANAMFRNDGGRFVDVAAEIGLADARRTVGAVWFDHDGDGDLDVISGNMDGDANGLFRQDGGKFVDVAESAGIAWGGRRPNDKSNGTVRPCVADVDNDGRLDLFFANYGKNGLFLNRGDGRFEDVSAAWGIDIDARYDSCAFGDFDNDGYLDLYVNGTITGGKQYDDYLFRNTGTRFEDVTPPEIGSPKSDHGAHWIDFDRDGNVDLSLTGIEKDGLHWLLRNVLTTAKAAFGVNIRVLDETGSATLAGSEISVTGPGNRRTTRLVDAGSGYNSQNDDAVHVVLPVGGMGGNLRVEIVARRGSRSVRHAVTLDNVGALRRHYEIRLPAPNAQDSNRAVPVHEEPFHRQVYDARISRVLDIQIRPGQTTLYHTHSDPILYVTMSTSRTRNQNLGGEWNVPVPSSAIPLGDVKVAPTVPPGRMMSTTSYGDKPQTHRVNNIGDTLFRLIGVTNTTAGDLRDGPSVGFDIKPELGNRWFRGYRYVVRRGETLEHEHANPVAVVLAAGGADLRSSARGGYELRATVPGFIEFVEGGTRHTLRGTSDEAHVIEVEIRQP